MLKISLYAQASARGNPEFRDQDQRTKIKDAVDYAKKSVWDQEEIRWAG
ncbi:unnamed protein product [Haemonchus placei]|uniref:Resolvase/invertase-type recombinase catalytic domain-containing protein n=1 Tax=Haemonchus placei TaxID=6290 RepID=A0A0N4WGP7_HAEPC|nr:unnamed protein product [Haemonchus placei]